MDYSTRSVISAGRINSNRASDQIVKFGYTGIPLSHLCNLFYPFFQYEIRNWAETVFSTVKELKDSKGNYRKIINPMENFTPDKITRMLNKFIKSPENRLDRIEIKIEGEDGKPRVVGLNLFTDELKRPFYLLDLIYMVAMNVCKDKHVYVTRYPVNNFQSIYPSRIKVMTTYTTIPLQINNQFFEDYPEITKEEGQPEIDAGKVEYIDTTIPHNTCLEKLDADFDGDTISLRSVYTQEANMEAERIINSPKYFLDVNGKNIRILRNEAIQTLFALTRE